ncbi:MAG: site-2 protease family protein [Bacilli bacterium]|nr:site-2 protease family protein [Bacilli bacterium]
MQVVLNIIIMLLILALLVSLHEAGHLSMAKLFKVYCFEYSIGFGPKLLRVKRKGGETYFAIRAFPLGGFVSMYGEGDEVPEGFEAPPAERSLEGIAKWKKAIILVAGVVVNYLLGLILLFVSVSCFPQYYSGYAFDGVTPENSSLTIQTAMVGQLSAEGSDVYNALNAAKESKWNVDDYVLFLNTRQFAVNKEITEIGTSSAGMIIDSDVLVTFSDGKTGKYVALYTPTNLVDDHSLSGSLYLYPQLKDSVGNVIVPSTYFDGKVSYAQDYAKRDVVAFPDLTQEYLKLSNFNDDGFSFDLKITFVPKPALVREEGELTKPICDATYDRRVTVSVPVTIKNKTYSNPGLTIKKVSEWNDWNAAWKDWARLVPQCNLAIIQGLGSLFTGGWANLSGIVGMTAAVGTYSSMGGAASIFMYAGLISINLAIFNLLPFPGLDGWQLLVTAIEGISKKKVPAKVKTIVSFVGLALLFGLFILITVKDIIGLF